MVGRPSWLGSLRFAGLVFLSVLGWTTPLHAGDSRYQDFVIGARALGLGGAFTSIADDPSGLFYNPAGITEVEESNFQISTSLYGFERSAIGEGNFALPIPGSEDLESRFTDLIIVPASAGYVSTFGPKDARGRPKQAYAISLLVPSFRTFAARNPGGDLSTGSGGPLLQQRDAVYNRRATDREFWAGIGIAHRFLPQLHAGISIHYVLRSVVDNEDVAVNAVLEDGDGDPNNNASVFRTAANDISFVNGKLVLVLGIKYKTERGWSLGLSFQAPSVPLHSNSKIQFTAAESVPSCASLGIDCSGTPGLEVPRSNFESEAVGGSSESPVAPTLRFGVSYGKPYRFTLSLDASYHIPIEYSLVKADALNAELLSRLPFNPRVERNGVVNLNAGAEYLIVREVSISGGMFSNFSSAPSISQNPVRDQQPDVDMKGATVALGYFGKHSMSRLGVLYSWGRGHDVIPATSEVDRVLAQGQDFRRVDLFQSFFYVFVSSTFRY